MMKIASRIVLLGLVLAVLSGLLTLCAHAAEGVSSSARGSAKNVIMLIADGCSIEQYTLARWFKGERLAVQEYRRGSVMTYIADSVIADSAPAGTAYATGHRTADKFISVSAPSAGMLREYFNSPAGKALKPLETILEKAVKKGLRTGIVVTCHFTHATPASFFSHVRDRDEKNEIARQAVGSGVHVVFGGGRKYLLPQSKGGYLPGDENLLDSLSAKGYKIIGIRDELVGLGDEKVWGLFADNDMLPEIDRICDVPPKQPSLPEMTAKAIELLSKGESGFFLMVEGSQIDWACHANDPGYMVHEILAFDEAVRTAFDFARKRDDTMVIAVSDHNTGGFSIGNRRTDETYSQTGIEEMLGPVRKMKRSSLFIVKELGGEPSAIKLKSLLQEFWGTSVNDEEAAAILREMTANKKNPQNALCDFFNPKHTVFGWTTHGHCGGDVPFAAFGPGAPDGSLDAPELGRICMDALGLTVDQ